MFCIELIGISGTELEERQRELLQSCRTLVASKRHQSLIAATGLPIIPIIPIVPLKEMLSELRLALQSGNVAVLASGDPLFYGIGRTLLLHFPQEQVHIHPAVSAVQLACAKFKIPWDDLTLLSLHGRDHTEAVSTVLRSVRTLLFTDSGNSPDRIARRLLHRLEETEDLERLAAIRIRVAENLGLDDECVHEGTVQEIAAKRFSPLNMMLIECFGANPALPGICFGLKEADIFHSRGLITKDEVRAVTLHKLGLPEHGVLWDVGGGSGSVSLEAARMNPELSVYTIEKKPEEQENIRSNIRKYSAYNIHLIAGEAPEALPSLPRPDRVFIGGSGKRLSSIIALAAAALSSEGRLVVNAVLAGTAAQAPQLLLEQQMRVETATVSVTRKQVPGEPVEFNPITIITGYK